MPQHVPLNENLFQIWKHFSWGSDIAAAHLINFSNLIIHISMNLSDNIWHHALRYFKASATEYAIIKVTESLYVTMYNLSFLLKIA